jgi:hypothetical protein
MWIRFLGSANRFDTFLQIDATSEIKFENDDDDDYDTRRAVATRYTTAPTTPAEDGAILSAMKATSDKSARLMA